MNITRANITTIIVDESEVQFKNVCIIDYQCVMNWKFLNTSRKGGCIRNAYDCGWIIGCGVSHWGEVNTKIDGAMMTTMTMLSQ